MDDQTIDPHRPLDPFDLRETGKVTKDYEEYFKEEDDSKRTGNYTDVVNKYYDLATSFYEYGWGESFHFAHRYKWETLRESIIRHEHFLASKLNVGPGKKVLDVGCGEDLTFGRPELSRERLRRLPPSALPVTQRRVRSRQRRLDALVWRHNRVTLRDWKRRLRGNSYSDGHGGADRHR